MKEHFEYHENGQIRRHYYTYNGYIQGEFKIYTKEGLLSTIHYEDKGIIQGISLTFYCGLKKYSFQKAHDNSIVTLTTWKSNERHGIQIIFEY